MVYLHAKEEGPTEERQPDEVLRARELVLSKIDEFYTNAVADANRGIYTTPEERKAVIAKIISGNG